MSEEKWICPACKAENTGSSRFCLTCGAPRFAKVPDTVQEEEKPLTFSELKQMREPHGALRSVSYSFWSNGMMMNSHEESEVTLKRLENDEAELLIRHESGLTGGQKDVYRVPAATLSEIEKIAERENMPAWSKMKYRPDPRFMPTDYSSSSHLSLTYGDINPKNPQQEYFSIDIAAVPREGAGIINDIISRMKAAAEIKNLRKHEDIPPKPMNGMMGIMGMKEALEVQKKNSTNGAEAGPERKLVFDGQGYWICPECGEHNPGKFCANCGSRRPEK